MKYGKTIVVKFVLKNDIDSPSPAISALREAFLRNYRQNDLLGSRVAIQKISGITALPVQRH